MKRSKKLICFEDLWDILKANISPFQSFEWGNCQEDNLVAFYLLNTFQSESILKNILEKLYLHKVHLYDQYYRKNQERIYILQTFHYQSQLKNCFLL